MGPNSGGNIKPSQGRNTKNCNENSDLKNLKSILENLKSILESSESTIEDLWKKLKEIADNEDIKSFFESNNIGIELDKDNITRMESITISDKRGGRLPRNFKIIRFSTDNYNILDTGNPIGHYLESKYVLRKDLKEELNKIITLIENCTNTDNNFISNTSKEISDTLNQ